MPKVTKQKVETTLIGNRVKSARMLSGHTRKSFAEVSGISVTTLRTWEEPFANRSGLTRKGAERLVKAFKDSRIHCTVDWLFSGKGAGPTVLGTSPLLGDSDRQDVTWGEEESIFKDIESFKENNKDPIVAVVADGAMLPRFSMGDYVAGSRLYADKIRTLVGMNCIVEFSGSTLIRHISSVTEDNKYTLVALHHDPTVLNPTVVGVSLDSAAEIVWHRWRKRIKNIRM